MTGLQKYDQISTFWMDYKDALRRYIFKIVKDSDTANELSHEVLMKVYSSCCSGRPIRNIRSWVFQIAYNTCMDHFRKTKRVVEFKVDLPQVEDSSICREAGEFIAPLLKLLPPKYAVPLELADVKGMKQQEVANELGLTLTATKTRVQRGRKLLKEEIMSCFHIELDQNGQLMAFDLKGSCEALKSHAAKQNE